MLPTELPLLWLGGSGGGGGFAAGCGGRPDTLGLCGPPPCAPDAGGGGAGPFFLAFEIEGLALGVNDGFEF